MKVHTLGSIVLFGLLAGCSQPKIISENQPSDSTAKKAERVEHVDASLIKSWDLSGAMSAKGKSKAWSAQIHWQQSGANQYQIRLFGPLGSGTVIIDGKKGRITYTDGPKKITSKNPDELFERETGLRLPVQNLYYWVRGLPAPGSVTSSASGQNHALSTLDQNGYHITYINYTMVHHAMLPTKIRLEGHGLLIKLVIRQWNV